MKFVLLLAGFVSYTTWAHQSSLNPSGNGLYWSNDNVSMVIRGNSTDLSSELITSIIQDSMEQWNLGSSASISPVTASNNEIRFVSNFPYGSAVIGVTELSYNTAGVIQKASILLNDDYTFYGSPGFYGPGRIYLGDVVTHEIGHVFGLSHSEVLDASMFYSSFSGQSSLGFDDKTGIRQKYDSGYGTIKGTVKGGNSIGILGAHVQAISRKTGKASAVVSDEDGNFILGGLDLDDTYYIYTAPIKNPESLPGYFSNRQDEFCPSSYVGSFFSKCGHANKGKPQGITLTNTLNEIDVGTITINCGLKTDQAYNIQKLQTNFSPITIFQYDPNQDKVEQAYVGWFRSPSSSEFSKSDIFKIDMTALTDNSFFLKFSIVSFPLGTQLEYEVDIKNSAGPLVSNGRSIEFSDLTETFNTDFEAFVPISSVGAKNLFEIKIRAKKLSPAHVEQTFPSFEEFSSGTYLPYLIVASIWEERSGVKTPIITNEANLSDNESCLDAPFTYAVSRAVDADNGVTESTDEVNLPAACGTIDPPKNGPGHFLSFLTLGFMLSIIAHSLIKTRK